MLNTLSVSNKRLLAATAIGLGLLTSALFLIIPNSSNAMVDSSVRGAILLDVQRSGEAWYINPQDNTRYYLNRPNDAFSIMSQLGVGISQDDLKRIPQTGDSWDGHIDVMSAARGRIVLDVANNGEAWYVSPNTGKRYYMGSPVEAFSVMQEHGVGATSGLIDGIPKEGELAEQTNTTITETEETVVSNGTVRLDIPFVAQAPTGNWSLPFSEACEESILLMLDHYRTGESIDAVAMEQRIRELVDWEQNTYGFNQDTSADITARTAEEYFGYDVRVTEDVSEASIKAELDKGNPVILPVYGKYLYNPHFLNGGPHYHMIMAIGYDGAGIITHEPGTRHGDGYRYSTDVLLNAIHDFTIPETEGANGRKVMIVVEDV